MGNNFEVKREVLFRRVYEIYSSKELTEEFQKDFIELINRVCFHMIQDKDNFYGHFLLRMGRQIDYKISSPTAINFRNSKYIIYFNPMIFLGLSLEQMISAIKHEIHHIIALHLIRGKELKGKVSPLAINMAMDIVVNQYLDNLPDFSVTLHGVNLKYKLRMEPFNSFEYYAINIQEKLDKIYKEANSNEDIDEDDFVKEFSPLKTHDKWENSDDIEDKTLKEFTLKYAMESLKSQGNPHIDGLIKELKEESGEIPWNIYLKRLMGRLEGDKKKTITRRDRRQPNRLDLRGELRGHKANITLAIDISASISNEEFEQAIREVLNIVRGYKNEITVLECDSEIKRIYKIKNEKGLKQRSHGNGGTKFSPVIEYVNKTNTDILIYFTDGEGEKILEIKPKRYKILWVLSGKGNGLSLNESYGLIKKLKKLKIKEQDALEMADVRMDGWSMNHQEPDL